MPNAKSPRPLVVGNWKMNGTRADLKELRALVRRLSVRRPRCDVMVCPPATLLSRMVEVKRGRVLLGGQDCHAAPSGAHTGDISAAMIKDAGGRAVILGHSERRTDYGETDKMVKAKVTAAHAAGLTAVVCVGETLKQRKAGETVKIVGAQLRGSLPDIKRGKNRVTAQNTVIAYEPVWAIGSGLTPTLEQVAEVHKAIRRSLVRRFADGAAVRILYGGSVKPSNAAELLAVENVNGALVGGASLKARDFLGIIGAYS